MAILQILQKINDLKQIKKFLEFSPTRDYVREIKEVRVSFKKGPMKGY